MSDDLVKRLRAGDAFDGKTISCRRDVCNCAIMDEAADEIERLRAIINTAGALAMQKASAEHIRSVLAES